MLPRPHYTCNAPAIDRGFLKSNMTLAFSEIIDMQCAPISLQFRNMQFNRTVLSQPLGEGLSVDTAWGNLEELEMKLQLSGELSSDDQKMHGRMHEALANVGIKNIASRPEWDLESRGALLFINPSLLEERFPDLASIGARFMHFHLLRSRLRELM